MVLSSRFCKLDTLLNLFTAFNIVLWSNVILAQPLDEDVKLSFRNYDSNSSLLTLKLALDKTKDLYGSSEIRRSQEISQGRAAILLQDQSNRYVDVINFVPEPERVESLLPIFVALEEGLVGHRICLIRKGEEEKFAGIKTARDFRERGLTIGQGAHWPDTKILQANDLPVSTNVDYNALFSMLSLGRFDCLLRVVHEVIEERHAYEDMGIVIEPSLVFVYPSVSLFFVNDQNIALANRIELGLRRAVLDGSFRALFESVYSDDLDQTALKDRRVIRLNNPLIDDKVLKRSSRHGIQIDGKIEN